MKEAIQKAIVGGWVWDKDMSTRLLEVSNVDISISARNGSWIQMLPYEKLWCDPLFWQSLGKALGWDTGEHLDWSYPNAPVNMPMWEWKWHSFINHLIAGKDPEEFFANLLKP